MIKIVYISELTRKSIDFINTLISDLQKLGIKNIKHDKQNNCISVGNIEVVGISVYEPCLCTKMQGIKYF